LHKTKIVLHVIGNIGGDRQQIEKSAWACRGL